MKYVTFDEKGNITAFYTEDIHKPKNHPETSIPFHAVEITEEEWRAALADRGKWLVDVEKKVLVLNPEYERLMAARKEEAESCRMRHVRIEELIAATNQADAKLSVTERMFKVERLRRGLPEDI